MERRKSPQMDVILKVRHALKEDFQEALIRSISDVSVFLGTGAPFAVGCEFLLEIHRSDKKGVIRSECEVAWVNQIEMEDFPKGMGVKFLDFSAGDRARLEEYLDKLRTQGRA